MDNITIIKSAIKANVPILLEGPTGTGKSYCISKLAQEQGKTLRVINVSGELTVDAILGQRGLRDGDTNWHDGVLTQAMKNGDWVLFDELNTALPEVLTVINGVLDDSRSVTLPNELNERVTAHVNFRFIGTQNPSGGQYAGTGRLNDALLNRMIRVEFGYMQPEQEVEALKEHTSMADRSIMALIDVAHFTRKEYDVHISTRDLVKVLRLRDKGGMNIRDALSIVVKDKYNQSEYNDIAYRFSDKLNELGVYTNGKDVDPIEHIREEHRKLEIERRKLEEEKANIRDTVKTELLRDLLNTPKETANA